MHLRFQKLQAWIARNSSFIGYPILIMTVTIGLMNVIHVITYRQPTDGARWEDRDGRLEVVETDLDADTSLQVGDILKRVDDINIHDIESYEEYLYSVPIGSKHLYLLERRGGDYEPWITIRGNKSVQPDYYLYATVGFIYLIFVLIIINQDIGHYPKRSLVAFSVCVFLAFVFHHTERLTLLDWISFYLDQFGRILLPSAFLAAVTFRLKPLRRWHFILQPLHWLPSCAILATVILWIPQTALLPSAQLNVDFYEFIQSAQRIWGGSLMGLGFVLMAIFETATRRRAQTLAWVIAWAPFTLAIWRLDYPFSWVFTVVATAVLPVVLLITWSRQEILYLGTIGRKATVYISVVLLLFLGYFLFIGMFQKLLGASISRDGQVILSGFAIMFAAISFTPLKNTAEEMLNRLIHGQRFESLKSLMDFAGINRADMEVDTFLDIIVQRIRQAFGYERAWAVLRAGQTTRFRSHFLEENPFTFQLKQVPTRLKSGAAMTGQDFLNYVQNPPATEAFQAYNTYLPIRVGDRVDAILILPGGAQDPSLGPEENRLLRNLTNQCEVLMENMQLYRSLEQKAMSIMKLKEYNENIIESSRIGILATDEMGKAVSCNRAFLEFTGLDRGFVIGKSFEEMIFPVEIQNERQVLSGFAMEGEFTNAMKQELILDVQKTPLKTRTNEIYGTLILVEDIREKREIHEQMMQQEKLASIGMLAAGIAHEINTPLTGINSYSQMLSSDETLDINHQELIRLIQNQGQRAAQIVRDLLDFSRREKSPKGPVDLHDVLQQSLKLLSHQFQKHGVQIDLADPDEPGLVDGYPNKIQQVFINIMVNALDAMPEGGRLNIAIEPGQSELTVCFRDTGHGMDAETQAHIFDPFFTTKEAGRGTGLGLSVVYNILHDHKARIEADSTPGEGTTMRLVFPISRSAGKVIT